MSDITVINDSEQSSLVTNGLAKNGELYLKAAGSTDAGAIVVYDSGVWRTFANEASAGFSNTYSVDFDGTNDYASLASGLESTINNASTLTVSAWVKINKWESTIFSSGTSLTDGMWLLAYDSSNFFFSARNGSSTAINVNPVSNFTLNNWHHVCGVLDGSNSKLYFDGSLVGSGTLPALGSTSGSNPSIGSYQRSNYYTGGLIDEVALFTSTLSASDVTAIYNSGVPTDLSSYSPVGWWRMGDDESGTGTTITDQGSGENDGTLTNGPTFSTDIPS
jgi:hypothetical protein